MNVKRVFYSVNCLAASAPNCVGTLVFLAGAPPCAVGVIVLPGTVDIGAAPNAGNVEDDVAGA